LGVVACLLVAQPPDVTPPPDVAESALLDKVQRLVRQLDDDDLERRAEAERELTALGPAALKHLPSPRRRASPEVKSRLARVRNRLQRDAALASTRASKVTLQGEMAFSQAMAALQKQTGNQVVDYRDRFGQQQSDPRVHCDFVQQDYWTVLDDLLDQAQLQLYAYGGTPRTLTIVGREPDRLPARGRVAYGGLFRVEPTRVQASRDLRIPGNTGLKLTLEIAWEPRVQPIAITQPMEQITARDENGVAIATDNRQAKLEVAVQSTVSAVEMDLPLQPPDRSVRQIASLRGTLDVVLPGREAEFRFPDLEDAKDSSQQNAGVTVVVQSVRPNLDVTDVRILVRFDEASGALQSHRGWIFDNQAFLIDGDGNREDHVGFETTAQRPNEVGLSYKFVVDKPMKDYTFVYRSAVAIIRVPVEYHLRAIDLP
jgi:hypothetical protein